MSIIAADRSTQVKAFDETKTGVKGLVDSGIKEIPAMFHAPPSTLATLKAPPPLKKLTIPTIDLKGGRVLDKNQDMNMRQSVVEKIEEAAEKWGFFQVINHGIPQDMLERMIEGVRGFHEQDQEVKKGFYSRDLTRKVVYYSNVDLFSSVAATWKDSLTFNMAPDPPRSEDLPEGLREIMVEYPKEVMKLGEVLFELLSEALGLDPNHLKEMGCAKSPSMVGNYYPPCPQPDLTLGISNHTDFSFITILLQSNIGGLQVLHDQAWIDVHPLPGALVVNIGDLLQLLTNDKFMSVEHRAIAHGSSEARVSVACFFDMLKTASPQAYSPIKELLSEHNLSKYRDCSLTGLSEIFSPKDISTRKLQHLRI